ncbi:MAG: enoyl-CoA hydratase/isomerase family protein [Novosphingobium sp.]|nr:enoyl-CoA hydratase/isomerase family protein [Novosphingobium sp.]MCP5403365.1 enoyl-CoA hydratase/isomerase family protein [Novosphingobium sp.]
MPVHYEEQDRIAVITIGRPEKRGALNAEGYRLLCEAWDRIATTPSVRVAVLTGTGESFCAGSDLSNFVSGDMAEQEEIGRYGSKAVLRNIDFPKPIIAAVGGPCMGSGFEVLLASDIRYATPDAVFGLPEVRRGLFSGGASTVRLPRQIPHTRAMEILLTGRRISAEEALAWGILTEIVERDALLDHAMAMARLIAANSPTAVQATKLSALKGLRDGIDKAHEVEQECAMHVFAGPDAREGPRAFFEKRDPVWAEATGLS